MGVNTEGAALSSALLIPSYLRKGWKTAAELSVRLYIPPEGQTENKRWVEEKKRRGTMICLHKKETERGRAGEKGRNKDTGR